MGEPAPIRTQFEEPEPPLHDPHSIDRAYRYHRARRHARVERRREKRWARVRFWFVLGCLLLFALAIIGLIMQQVHSSFGI